MDDSKLLAEGAEKGRGDCTVAAGKIQAVEIRASVVLPDAAGSGVVTKTSAAETAMVTIALRCKLRSAWQCKQRLHQSGKVVDLSCRAEVLAIRTLASVLQS